MSSDYDRYIWRERLVKYYHGVIHMYNRSEPFQVPDEIILPEFVFKDTCTNHKWIEHHDHYKCCKCGTDEIYNTPNIIPDEIISLILRSHPDLYYSSCAVSHSIRAQSLPGIIKNDFLRPIHTNEIYDTFYTISLYANGPVICEVSKLAKKSIFFIKNGLVVKGHTTKSKADII